MDCSVRSESLSLHYVCIYFIIFSLAQFWNIPINTILVEGTWYLQIYYPEHPKHRQVPAMRYHLRWDHEEMICYYAGNKQGGPELSHDPNESVIEGVYSEYKTASLFATEFVFSEFDESQCES